MKLGFVLISLEVRKAIPVNRGDQLFACFIHLVHPIEQKTCNHIAFE